MWSTTIHSIIGTKKGMETMNNLISLDYNPKKDDPIKCKTCNIGIIVPNNPESKINHGFHCNYCNEKIDITPSVVVE